MSPADATLASEFVSGMRARRAFGGFLLQIEEPTSTDPDYPGRQRSKNKDSGLSTYWIHGYRIGRFVTDKAYFDHGPKQTAWLCEDQVLRQEPLVSAPALTAHERMHGLHPLQVTREIHSKEGPGNLVIGLQTPGEPFEAVPLATVLMFYTAINPHTSI